MAYDKKAVAKYRSGLSTEIKIERWRKHDLRKNHVMSIEEYNKLFELQKGCCAICNRHQSEFKRHLAVDHNHTNGKNRSLLCVVCNTNLAVLEDKEFCMKASLYLQRELL